MAGLGSFPAQRALSGLQSAGGRGGGLRTAGMPGTTPGFNWNLYNRNRQAPRLNPQGGMTYTQLPPVQGYYNGQAYYGHNPDGSMNFNPVSIGAQFRPGESPFTPRATGTRTSPGTQPGEQGGLVAPLPNLDRIPEIGSVDDSEAAREAYARAKDVAGQQGRAALDSLMDIQGARGIVGSGIGVNEAGGVIAEGARQLGDFNREQAIQRVENERRRRELNYQGLINQRGQDYTGREQELRRRMFNAGNSPRGTTVY